MTDAKNLLTSLSDEQLMIEYKLGNSEAFEVLYRRHSGKVYGYLSGKLVSKSQVEDVYQESLLRLHRFRDRYDASFPFLPWLFTICRNAMVDHLRKAGRERSVEVDTIFDQRSDKTFDASSTINEQLEGLSTRESSVLQLHYLQGYSFDEVASHLEIQPSNARKISSRAIKKLKALWK
jgi:RNA polymerase sigma factor (sigma-70 family)